ncbi:MAG TPA: hypothetical protein K8V56_09530 [Sporosarcina psychrophila]|uniref:Uncharacterized protein n=1 Tax=Sporosarcina psychrophila TaxID=1476 RepID=A0A921FYH2_SPOPS|nr:hypothetical protein [Sporosarcina psychrophila]
MQYDGVSIAFYILSLYILYLIIERAVRKGINNSIIGQVLEKKYGIKEDKKTILEVLEDDLDKDK